jgi:hypothetical protein
LLRNAQDKRARKLAKKRVRLHSSPLFPGQDLFRESHWWNIGFGHAMCDGAECGIQVDFANLLRPISAWIDPFIYCHAFQWPNLIQSHMDS